MVPPENFWRIDPDLSNPGIVAESPKWTNRATTDSVGSCKNAWKSGVAYDV